MCAACADAIHSVALWTRVTSHVSTCVQCVPMQSIPWHHTCTIDAVRCDMRAVRTDAVHSVALWTRVTSHVSTCVQCVPMQSIPWHHTCTIDAVRCDMRAVRTDAVHSVALWPRETSRFDMCVVCTNAVNYIIALWTRITSDVWTCVQCVPIQSIALGRVWRVCCHMTCLDMCKVCTEAGSDMSAFLASPLRRGIRLLGFSASPEEFGFSASRLRPRNSASRLLGFARGIRLLGFSASPGEFGFSASRLRSGNSASRLLGFPPLSAGPLYRRYAKLPNLYRLKDFHTVMSRLRGFPANLHKTTCASTHPHAIRKSPWIKHQNDVAKGTARRCIRSKLPENAAVSMAATRASWESFVPFVPWFWGFWTAQMTFVVN